VPSVRGWRSGRSMSTRTGAVRVERRAARGSGWLLAPYAAGLIGLLVLPLLIVASMAFTDSDLVRPPAWVGVQNFTDLLDDPLFRIALRSSLLFVAWAVPWRLVGAVGLSLLLHRRMTG